MVRGGIVAVAMGLALLVACGGESRRQNPRATTAGGAGMGTGGVGGLAAAEGGNGAGAGAPECVAGDDCVAVYDTHQARVNCYLPTPASRAEAESDPCLIPWLPNPKCSLPEPEPSCVLPLEPGMHSCPATPPCVTPRCVAGSCTLDSEGCAPPPDDRDCETLRAEYVALLELGRGCDPTRNPPSCLGNLADTCGCALPYDVEGPHVQKIWCAFDAWRNAACGVVDCGHASCTMSGDPVCRANGDGTGTCEYPPPP